MIDDNLQWYDFWVGCRQNFKEIQNFFVGWPYNKLGVVGWNQRK